MPGARVQVGVFDNPLLASFPSAQSMKRGTPVQAMGATRTKAKSVETSPREKAYLILDAYGADRAGGMRPPIRSGAGSQRTAQVTIDGHVNASKVAKLVSFHPTMFRSRILLVFIFITTADFAVGAEKSLYEGKSARQPNALEQERLGPASKGLRYDARMLRAVKLAQDRARERTTWHCWAYVKNALVAANVVSSRPTTPYARQAGEELERHFGFKKIRESDPRRAPIGAVVVYGGGDAGHVEMRTERGFVSDFFSTTPYPRPVLGIYVKQS